jgi:serine phosphatase RsbU (regulator of sigma subunit)
MVTALPAIAVLAALAVVLALSHRNSSADDRRMETRQLAVAAAVNARRFVDDQFAILGAVAADPEVRQGRYRALRPYLRDVVRGGRFSSGLGVIDAKGLSRVSTSAPANAAPVDVSGRVYFQQALAGRLAVSDVLLSKRRNRPILAFAYPTTGARGKLSGALAGSIALDQVSTGLRRLLYAPGAGETIIDGAGHVIVGNGAVTGLQAAPRSFPLERMQSQAVGLLETHGRLLGYSEVRGTDWVVVIDRSHAAVIGPIDRALWAEIAAIALLALVGVLLTMSTARRLDALDRERDRALAEQRAIALQLQTSLLPALRVPDGIEAHAGYVPAQGAMSVGGDWYDLVAMGDGRVALSVGDVAGHGLAAAATMGKLRSATRSEALRSADPVTALAALDRFAGSVDGRPLATVVYAVLDLESGALRYALAGHPPPLLIRADGSTAFLEEGRSPLLGVAPTEPRAEGSAWLAAGDTLLLYTDGLVERPESSIDAGLELLAKRASALVGNLATMADRLLASVEEPRRDDAAVLVVRLVGGAQPSSVAA